jgi:hypothetical protein
MNKSLDILTERRSALDNERKRLEHLLLKEDVACNIESFERQLRKLRAWIAELDEGIAILQSGTPHPTT